MLRPCTHTAFQPAGKHEATKHTHAATRPIVSSGSVWHYHVSRLLVIEKFLLGIVSGFRVENLSTVFCCSDLSHDDGADQSSSKLDSHLGHSRLFGNEPITTPLPSALSPVSRFTSMEKKQQKRHSHWHQASFASGPICTEYDCDCCFNLGAILKCQIHLFQTFTGL